MQPAQRLAVHGIAGHEGRHLDPQVAGELGLQQLVQQLLAHHVERHLAAGARPQLAQRLQQRGGVDLQVGLGREHREPGGDDGAVAVDHRRVAEHHLAEDGMF